MDQEFFDFCRENYREDGQYAVAYAILLSGNSQVIGVDYKNKTAQSVGPSEYEIECENIIRKFLKEHGATEFCFLELWEKVLLQDSDEYSKRYGRMLGRIIKGISGIQPLGTRFTNYDKQKCYRYTPPTLSNDLGI